MSWLEANTGMLTQGTVVDGVDWGEGKCNPLSIVLSNPCDLEHEKASFIMLAALIPASDTIQESKEFKEKIASANANCSLVKKKWDSLSNFLESYVLNKNVVRYFFINPKDVIDVPPLLIDFQLIKTIPFNEKNKLDLVAQLPSPFKEKMIVHFSSYISRIGVERSNPFEITSLITNLASPYIPSTK